MKGRIKPRQCHTRARTSHCLGTENKGTQVSWDRMGEIRAILENLVPVLAKTWGNIPRDGKVVGFKSGYGEG